MLILKKRFAESDMKTRWVCNEQGIMELFGAVALEKIWKGHEGDVNIPYSELGHLESFRGRPEI